MDQKHKCWVEWVLESEVRCEEVCVGARIGSESESQTLREIWQLRPILYSPLLSLLLRYALHMLVEWRGNPLLYYSRDEAPRRLVPVESRQEKAVLTFAAFGRNARHIIVRGTGSKRPDCQRLDESTYTREYKFRTSSPAELRSLRP